MYTLGISCYYHDSAAAVLKDGRVVAAVEEERFSRKKFDDDLNFKSILIIGILQIFALIPGASRSGVAITAGRFLNFDRYDSSKISFYLSIPALAGASTLGIKDAFDKGVEFNILVMFSIIFSFLFSYLTIKYFLAYVKKFNLNIFIYYRILLAGILLIVVYA